MWFQRKSFHVYTQLKRNFPHLIENFIDNSIFQYYYHLQCIASVCRIQVSIFFNICFKNCIYVTVASSILFPFPFEIFDNVKMRPVFLSWLTCIMFFQIRVWSLLVILTMLVRDRTLFLCSHAPYFTIYRPVSLGNLDNDRKRPVSLSLLTFIIFFTNQRPVSSQHCTNMTRERKQKTSSHAPCFTIHSPVSLGNLDNDGKRPASFSLLTFIIFFTNLRPVSSQHCTNMPRERRQKLALMNTFFSIHRPVSLGKVKMYDWVRSLIFKKGINVVNFWVF